MIDKKLDKNKLLELVKSGKIKNKDGSKVNLSDPNLKNILSPKKICKDCNKEEDSCECDKEKCKDCNKVDCKCNDNVDKDEDKDKDKEELKDILDNIYISQKYLAEINSLNYENSLKYTNNLIKVLDDNNKILSDFNKSLKEKNKLEKEENLKEKNKSWNFKIKRDDDGYIEEIDAFENL